MFFLQSFVLTALVGTSHALRYVGVDWSSVAVEEASGITYTSSSGAARPLEQILAQNGVNTVRQRLWVHPSADSGAYDLDYNIELARRAAAQGLGVYLDLHLSDTWADPAHQAIPSGWPADIDNLAWTLYNYTLAVSNAFAAAGVAPSIISIGNEIRAGMLWPTGKYSQPYNLARLLHSGAWGIKDSNLSPQPSIMIHLDNGWDWPTQRWFYDLVLGQGPLSLDDFDAMGVSYYPFYGDGATLGSLESSLRSMAGAWGKDLVVAETDWPTSCPSPAQAFPADLRDIPFSADGQREFIQRVASIVEGVPGGAGLFYWEPAWVDNAALGSSCASNTMFQWPGRVLSSLSVFSTI